ncbi:MAG: four helix bundle protein [Chloroflexi bacterium]|jgi:four helix bundle protein|nr:four helix bundle protein [Candidatus Roseilinea sp. NK_OTU-006]RMG62660.1 MAG: four helix bundle protein [Chloroflexota bacterium]
MHNYENLKVWQRGMDFTVSVYQASARFPSEERFGLTSQLRRASSAIPMNIAEGSGNSSDKEFCRFLEIAMRSGYEALTAIEIARRLGYVENEHAARLSKEAHEIVGMLIGLIRKLRSESK